MNEIDVVIISGVGSFLCLVVAGLMILKKFGVL